MASGNQGLPKHGITWGTICASMDAQWTKDPFFVCFSGSISASLIDELCWTTGSTRNARKWIYGRDKLNGRKKIIQKPVIRKSKRQGASPTMFALHHGPTLHEATTTLHYSTSMQCDKPCSLALSVIETGNHHFPHPPSDTLRDQAFRTLTLMS